LGKVTAILIPGLDLWFNSSDHLPPHFHARKPGCWEIRVYILLCHGKHLEWTLKWPRHGSRPGRKEREAILAATLERRTELLAEWEAKVVAKEEF